MDRAIKINETLVGRLDAQLHKYSLGTRQNLANTLIRKGLDVMESQGYEELLKLPNQEKNEARELDSTRQESCEVPS